MGGLESADLIDSHQNLVVKRPEVDAAESDSGKQGLWKSIFGYFRGPKPSNQLPADSKSEKEVH